MKRTNARLLALLLAMILALSMMATGCGGSGGEEETGSDDPVIEGGDETEDQAENGGEEEKTDGPELSTWEPMRAGKPVTYFLNSGVTYNYHSDEDAASKMADLEGMENPDKINVGGSYYTIDGLADEELEARINEQIYDMYLAQCERTELPAYRGVKTVERRGELHDISIYPGYVGYCGNLLSVSTQKCWGYVDGEDWYWIRDNDYAVFDMKTGGLVTLESLFGDNVDYLKILDEQVEKQLPAVVDEQLQSYEHNGEFIWNDGTIKQVAPFDGVRPDQPFQVDYQGIILFFDENDPEFDTDFGGFNQMTIYYDDIKNEAVYPVRFAAEQELYVNPLEAMLVVNYRTTSEAEHTNEKNFDKSIDITWPADMSIEVRDKLIEKDRKDMMEMIDGWYINNYIKIEENWGYMSYYCYVSDIGGYYSVEHSLYGGCDDNYVEQSVRRIFDKKTLIETPIDYVFMPGYDLRAALFDQMADNMVDRESYNPGTVIYTPEEAWDGRSGGINLYGISFVFPINDFGGYVTIYKNYTDLGYENLRMFQ
ncbi:MAG: hypothetical protein IJ486_00090 [Firmicutes bacterium]|nr:hypothetical protein [Bacillota bacterium]